MNEPPSVPPRESAPPAPGPWAMGTLLFALAFWLLDLGVLGAGTPHPLDDVWEYAVAARALIEGDGFRTPMIHPPLWAMRDAAGTVPILIHGPLVPVLFVPLVLVFGPHAPDGAAWLAAAFAVAGALLTFRLGAARFGPPVGAAAAGLFTASPLTLQSVHHDLALLAGAALLAAALALLLDPRPRRFASGAALGLAYLARPEMLLAAPLLAIGAGRSWGRLLAGFALVAAPWWIHQWLATGQPFFNLSSYLLIGYWSRDELSPLRDFSLTPARWPEVLRQTLPALPAKWADLFPHAMKRALMAPSGGTGWLAALGGLFGLFSREHRARLGLALPLAAIPVLVQTLTLYDSRYLVPFLPLWTLSAAWAAERLASRVTWARRPRAWIAALALMVAPSIAPAIREGASEARELRARLARERAALAERSVTREARGQSGPMFSDTPDFVAWTTGRTVLWLNPAEYERLPRAGEPNPADLPVRGRAGETWFEAGPSFTGPDSVR